jgi:hypothetical protein
MTSGNSLQEELGVFESHKPEWLDWHHREFVAIAGATVVGFFPDFESALKAGVKVVGLGRDFLVKQILAQEPVYFIF